MIKGFKEFILRGNVIDLAVAVVIGAAFTGIVNAIVAGLINPLIALIFQADSLNDIVIQVPNIRGGQTDFGIGLIIGAIINFLAVAVGLATQPTTSAHAYLPRSPTSLPTIPMWHSTIRSPCRT